MRSLLVILLLAGDLLGAEPSAEQRQQAKDLADAGSRHFRGGDLDQAAAEFKQAYDLSGNLELLWNLGQTYRLAKNYERAVFFYRQYRAAKSDLSPKSRESIDKRIVEMDALIEQQHHAQTAPPGSPDSFAEPPHAKATAPTVEASQRAGSVSTSPTPAPRKVPVLGYVIGGAGVAVAAVGGALLGVAMSEDNSARSATTQTSFDMHHSNDLTYQKAGWPLLGLGVGALASGVVIIALNARHQQ